MTDDDLQGRAFTAKLWPRYDEEQLASHQSKPPAQMSMPSGLLIVSSYLDFCLLASLDLYVSLLLALKERGLLLCIPKITLHISALGRGYECRNMKLYPRYSSTNRALQQLMLNGRSCSRFLVTDDALPIFISLLRLHIEAPPPFQLLHLSSHHAPRLENAVRRSSCRWWMLSVLLCRHFQS